MIRGLWFALSILPNTAIHSLVAIGAALFRVPRRSGGIYDWATVDWSRRILRAAGTPVRVHGLELIPRDTPVVYASNHTSMFDIWALAANLPGSTRFVAKQELARLPLVGLAMQRAGHIMIDRFNRARALEAYDRAAATIRSGISPIVFPEGTRSPTGELLPFKNAPFGFAISAQVPIVPIYVDGTYRILPKGSLNLKPMPIVVQIGAPIPTAGLTLANRDALRDQVRAAILELKSRVDATTPSH
ncbi:MAG TPA: lysophospholipid acyltransferase family protein [Gemmatimonadales bacterium]|nr:lysophospholipid acyltransferase family protein [Gemmatimonadales bacterium]